jgi:adenylate cyclase
MTARPERISAFLDALASRAASPLPQGDRASLTQLAYDFLDPVPPRASPTARTLSVLIVDLRGFSLLAEHRGAGDLIAVLEPFFSRMTTLVHEHGGFVDKFLGDGVMALFGAPEACDDHLQQALTCAARMQQAMLDINAQHLTCGLPEIHAGIGINSGEVMVGSFGPTSHSEYTAIGEAVNLASRIESFCLRGQVLLSEDSYRAARDYVDIGAIRSLRIKGRRGPINLYELSAVRTPQRIRVPQIEMRHSPRVPVQLPLHFYRVQDKRVTEDIQQGSILNLGYDGMLAQVGLDLPSLSEISFSVSDGLTATAPSELYARALHSRARGDGWQTAFAFTSTGTPGHEAVRAYVDRLLWGAA